MRSIVCSPGFSEKVTNYVIRTIAESSENRTKRESDHKKSKQSASPRLEIGKLSPEDFKPNISQLYDNPKKSGHSISDHSKRPLYVIEVLIKESTSVELQVKRRRHISHRSRRSTLHGVSLQDVPDRIRIRTPYMLNLLRRITNVKLDHGGSKASVIERTALVFLYPFKFFITYADKIEAEVTRLNTKFEGDNHAGQPHTSTTPNNPSQADDLNPSSADVPVNRTAEGDGEDDYDSEKALRHLNLLKELLGTYLKPIFDLRNGFRNAEYETVAFQDLWLLFEVGGLVFQREPQAHYPPCISRVTQFDGGRQLLNNSEFKTAESRKDIPGPNSKGVENRFYIRHYRLDFDGEHYGPIEDAVSIPPWDGTRSVYDLKVFPLGFCRTGIDHSFANLKDFQDHIISRGRKFIKLDLINHRYYNGQVVGSKHEFVSIDYLHLALG